MASPSGFVPPVTLSGLAPPRTPFLDGTPALQTSNTPPTAPLTTTVYTNSGLDSGAISSGTVSLASVATSPTLSSGVPTSPSFRDGSDNLTASPVYLFIFAIALGALIILSLTIVIRSLVLRQRLMALHGPEWRRQYGWTILEMLGLSSRRMWPDPTTQPGPQPGRRRRDHGRKPVLVDVYVSEGKDSGNWKDVQPYSTSLRHPDNINPSVKSNTISLLSLRPKEYQPPQPRSSNRTHSSTRPARDQPLPTPTRSPLSPLSPLRHLPFRATPPPPPTAFKPHLSEKYPAPASAPSRHSRSSSASSVRDLKSAEQPLPGLGVDVCLLVRMPTSAAPSYPRRRHRALALAGVSEEEHHVGVSVGVGVGETRGGELVIACAHGVQLWGVPEGPPPEIPDEVDPRSRRGPGQ